MEETAVNWTEWVIHRIFYWEEDNAKKGRIVRAIHTGTSYVILLMVVLSFSNFCRREFAGSRHTLFSDVLLWRRPQ